jgi:hypothetical protein
MGLVARYSTPLTVRSRVGLSQGTKRHLTAVGEIERKKSGDLVQRSEVRSKTLQEISTVKVSSKMLQEISFNFREFFLNRFRRSRSMVGSSFQNAANLVQWSGVPPKTLHEISFNSRVPSKRLQEILVNHSGVPSKPLQKISFNGREFLPKRRLPNE